MQIGIAGVPPRTKDMLDFIIVGGGLTGLATAWSLQKVGHRVTLFEQQDHHVMSQCREGVRSPPSMTQIINDWGIGDKFSKVSTPIDQITFLDGKTGDVLGLIAINKIRGSLPADFTFSQYGELFTIFYDLAKQAGVHLHYNTKVISLDPWKATVTCEDGRRWTANLIVGADGLESIVRPVVLDTYTPESDCDNRFSVNLVVPSDVLEQDEELAPLLRSKCWPVWLGDDCVVGGSLTGPGPNREYALVIFNALHSEDNWAKSPSALADLFESRVRKLLKNSKELSRCIFTHHAPFDNWVHESGKVVIVGDAAHPTIPSGSNNLFPCIEDAMTLSMLFSLPASKSQTPMLLNAFEELRQPRCAAVQLYVRRKREILTMPYGRGQRRRDKILRTQRDCYQEDELDDEFLCNTYSGFLQLYGFDAREAVQDWWVQWGRGISNHSPKSEGEQTEQDDDEEGLNLVPVIIDAEVERGGPGYSIILDPLMGEDEDVAREAQRRSRG